MTISREKLLAKTARRYVEVILDGDTYRIQSLSEKERCDYELSLQDKKGKFTADKLRRMLLVKTLVDSNGARLLQDSDEALLREVDGRTIGVLYDRAKKHCGYDDDELEAITKNSDETADS